jgi:hypothetical protein
MEAAEDASRRMQQSTGMIIIGPKATQLQKCVWRGDFFLCAKCHGERESWRGEGRAVAEEPKGEEEGVGQGQVKMPPWCNACCLVSPAAESVLDLDPSWQH